MGELSGEASEVERIRREQRQDMVSSDIQPLSDPQIGALEHE